MNDAPDIGLVGATIGVPNPQILQEGEDTEKDIVKSSVLALLDVSIHLT